MHVFSSAIRRTAWTVIILVAALFLGAQQSQAQDYHFEIWTVWADQNPLACPSRVSALVLALGDKDYEIQSGEAKIRFWYQKDGGQWNQMMEELPIEWEPNEGGLYKGSNRKVWPTDFPSAPTNSVEFRHKGQGSYRFKAETVYPSYITNGVASSQESGDYQAAGICERPPPCVFSTTTTSGNFRVLCFNFDIKAHLAILRKLDLHCKLFPESPLCGGGGWGGGIDPCKFGLQCPEPLVNPFPIEVLFDNRINKFNLAVIDTNGTIVAEMKQLTRPMKVSDSTYNQRLQYIARPGEEYRIIYWSSGKIKTGEQMPFPLLIRPMKPGKRQR